MDLINLPKKKSLKTYFNYLPVDIIKKINEKIPPEKKYKNKIKNKIKINKIIKSMKHNYEIHVSGNLYSDIEDEVQFARENIINYHHNSTYFIDIIKFYNYKNNRTKIKENLLNFIMIKEKLQVNATTTAYQWFKNNSYYSDGTIHSHVFNNIETE